MALFVGWFALSLSALFLSDPGDYLFNFFRSILRFNAHNADFIYFILLKKMEAHGILPQK
ncbi:hypothetical protein WN944_011879 [Citrus x changshan-huyou]|uniref:Uncharacterized protein n=1 Tax=Citrus x changshan-huyou TaxID=2935761 RepID=A0AAP0QZ59_9ROSI